MATSPLYTISCRNTTIERLVAILLRSGIRYAIDIRLIDNYRFFNALNYDVLKNELGKVGITYASFTKEFGAIPSSAFNRNGDLIYSKAVSLQNVQVGLNRINKGLEDGHTIAIIDTDLDTGRAIRFLLIGTFFANKGIPVYHIGHDSSILTHQQMISMLENEKTEKRNRKLQAQEVGAKGELLAALYLTNKGYRILDTNWNLHRGCELDIVSYFNGVLHFVEVKTRSTDAYGSPDQAIDRKKMFHLIEAIKHYKYEKNIIQQPHQLDSISIIYHSDDDYTLEHNENIYLIM